MHGMGFANTPIKGDIKSEDLVSFTSLTLKEKRTDIHN